jgi:conjugative relaxase-like TrwC/TraI family protein
MFTAKPQKNRVAATTYFDEHLSHNDYYTQKETQAGYWLGEGAQKLGLKLHEPVTREAFLKLCDNQHPVTGEKLTQLHLSGRRVFFDFTCSAPKSVSIMAVTMNDRRIVTAHREAATIAIRELESFAATRVRKDGAMEDRMTGNLVGAEFLHTSSRALDPQLHTHFTLFNATFDPVEGRWKALQTVKMFEAIHYGTAVYRNELAKRLHGLGYDTRATAHGFEIEGVEQKLIERFSKRAQQRDAAVAREERRLGRKLTNNEVSHRVHKSRPGKLKNASEEDLRAGQLDEIGFFEKRALRAVMREANGQRKDFKESVSLGIAADYAIQHAFSRQSVAQEHELLEAALVKGCGQIDLPELKRAFTRYERLVHVGREYSTREILRAEWSLIRSVNDGLNSVQPIAPRYEAGQKLSADQRAALKLVLSSHDRISGFRGLAGTGKTTTLQELRHAVEDAGLSPVFCAPTAAATDVLRKDGFAEASTLAKLLHSDALPKRAVLVLDEAGFVGTKDMGQLFDLARRAEARVVLVGDTGQHAPVAQGDALRIIEEHSGYRYGTLTKIWRQRSEDFKETVSLAAKQETGEAFHRLQKAGDVIEVEDSDKLYQKAAEAYLQATAEGKQALLVSPTWAEIEAVTDEVREQLREQGTIAAEEETVHVFDPLSWTDAQKQLTDHYEPGLRLRFVKNTTHFKAGETAEVVEVKNARVFLRRVSDGATAPGTAWSPSRSPSSFEVGEARELAVAAGDVLLLRANAPGFVNGERVTVKKIEGQKISLTDGRELSEDYRTFTHGYAVTSHAAQGKTVDEVMVVASSRSFAAVSQEQFYVSISRARERARVFTDDEELLGRRVEDSHTRKAAIELDGLREALAANGYTRAERRDEAVRETRSMRPEHMAERVVRQMRELRELRLAATEYVMEWAQNFRQWLGHRQEVKQELVQRERQTRTVREDMKISPRQSQSRGMGMHM